jgi:hypothetical protein
MLVRKEVIVVSPT